MKIKKSDLVKLIKESVQTFVRQEAGMQKRRGNTNFHLQMEIGEIEVEADISPSIPATYMDPPEGGEMELISLYFNGAERSLEELAQMESDLTGDFITEQELYERIEELAHEHGPDEQDYHSDADY
jgi:hypothetical protein